MEKRAVKKKRVGRPAGQRPVVAMRVHPDVYADLVASAKSRKIPIAEDAANRLQQSFHWDKALGDTNKLRAETQRIIAAGKEAALHRWGLRRQRSSADLPAGGCQGSAASITGKEKLERLLTSKATTSPEELHETGELGGRNAIYDACASGEIECFRMNKRIFIPTAPLRRKLGLEPA